MLKNTVAVFALGLIALFVVPGKVFAGPFGLFKRCRATAKCGDCCQAPARAAVSEAWKPGDPEEATTYYCQAFYEGEDEDGDACVVAGDMQIGSDCEALTEAAIQSAYDNAEDSGCYESSIEVQCYPPCPERTLMRQGDCSYKATYKICCCNGFLIDVPFYDASLKIAKFEAKTFACNLAAAMCGEGIRWCRSEICRVPGVAQAQCGK